MTEEMSTTTREVSPPRTPARGREEEEIGDEVKLIKLR